MINAIILADLWKYTQHTDYIKSPQSTGMKYMRCFFAYHIFLQCHVVLLDQFDIVHRLTCSMLPKKTMHRVLFYFHKFVSLRRHIISTLNMCMFSYSCANSACINIGSHAVTFCYLCNIVCNISVSNGYWYDFTEDRWLRDILWNYDLSNGIGIVRDRQ